MTRNSHQDSLPADAVARVVAAALAEDHTAQDVTTLWTVPADLRVRGHIEARAAGTIAGLHVAGEVFRQIDAEVQIRELVRDGDRLPCGERVLEIDGPARSILTGERVALNFLQRLSGIATTAAAYVARVHDLPVKIMDTRKTAPGLRLLDKYAVACGGATNHRPDLSEMVLIKENHLAAAGGIGPAVCAVRQRFLDRPGRDMQVEVEVGTVDQARQALDCHVDWILLDNMTLDDISAVVRIRDADPGYAGIRLEASGNVTLRSVRPIALRGVDAISVGALTHSAAALDLSLLVDARFGTRWTGRPAA